MSHFFGRPHSDSGWGKGLLGFAAGAVAAYYLYGTEAGKEKRKKMGRYAKDLKDKAGETKDTVVEYADSKKEDVAKLAGRVKGHLKEMKDDIGDTLG